MRLFLIFIWAGRHRREGRRCDEDDNDCDVSDDGRTIVGDSDQADPDKA